MRSEIRQMLLDNLDSIKGVWEPSSAGPELKKPYLIIREGVRSESDPYKDFTTIYEVWPYTSRTTFKNVDNLSKQTMSVLHRKRFDVGGVPHYIEYTGSITDDVVDDEWDALTRGMSFRVFSLAWLLHTPIEPDPVEAMKGWVESHFSEMQTNPLQWNPTDENPALYWRVSNISNVEPTNWGSWINATMKGHLIATNLSKRGKWLDAVIRKLSLDARTTMSDNSRMTFQSISADNNYDPFGEGQITLNVRFGILQEAIEYEQIKTTTFDDIERGGVVSD